MDEPAELAPQPREPVDPAGPPPPSPAAAAPSVLERLRSSPVTYALTAINVAVFLYAEYRGGGTSSPGTLLRFGALEPFHVWAGEYWRLVTCMFLHIGVVHIAVNTYMSLGWSTMLERALGKWRFLALYLLSGVGGSCMSVIVAFLSQPHRSAGASGALFGVIGATLAIRRRHFPDNASFLADRGVRSILVQFAILTVVGLTVLPLDNAAHVGGLLTGAFIGTLYTSRAPRNGWLVFAAAFAALFIFAVRPWWSPTGKYKDLVAVYANSYLTGKSPTSEGDWPTDVARGVRFAEKGCARGVALSCEVLARHLDRTGEPARAEELHRRACELESQLCTPQH